MTLKLHIALATEGSEILASCRYALANPQPSNVQWAHKFDGSPPGS